MADSKLPCVTDMVPRIWYAVMSMHTASNIDGNTSAEFRDQKLKDIAFIVAHLSTEQRKELDVALLEHGFESNDRSLSEHVAANEELMRVNASLAARAESSERALLESVRHTENQRRELAKLHAALRQKAPVDSPLTDSAGWNAWAAGWCEKLGLHGFDGIWHSAEAQDAIGKELAKKGASPPTDRDAAIVRAAEALIGNWRAGFLPASDQCMNAVRVLKAAVDLPKGAPAAPAVAPLSELERRVVEFTRRWMYEPDFESCDLEDAVTPLFEELDAIQKRNVSRSDDVNEDVVEGAAKGATGDYHDQRIADAGYVPATQLATEYERGRRDGFYAGREACLTAIDKKFPHMKDDVAKGIGNACYGVPYEPAPVATVSGISSAGDPVR